MGLSKKQSKNIFVALSWSELIPRIQASALSNGAGESDLSHPRQVKNNPTITIRLHTFFGIQMSGVQFGPLQLKRLHVYFYYFSIQSRVKCITLSHNEQIIVIFNN